MKYLIDTAVHARTALLPKVAGLRKRVRDTLYSTASTAGRQLMRPKWKILGTDSFAMYQPLSPKIGNELISQPEEFVRWCDDVRNALSALQVLNDGSLYENLLNGLCAATNVDLVPLEHICSASAGHTRVALRHDIDAGIWSAAPLGEMLAKRRLPGAFFVLHTAHYYGVFADPGIFLRQPCCRPYLERLIQTGCEVGLHNNALGVFLDRGTDGYAAVTKEISWLRSLGARVGGTTAHNSAPVYGLENFQIFSSFAPIGDGAKVLRGKKVPVGRISMQQRGLTYEGNFPAMKDPHNEATLNAYLNHLPEGALHNRNWLETHFLRNPVFESQYDVDIWLVGADRWFIAARRPTPLVEFPVTLKEVLDFIARDRHQCSIVLNIHPDYFA